MLGNVCGRITEPRTLTLQSLFLLCPWFFVLVPISLLLCALSFLSKDFKVLRREKPLLSRWWFALFFPKKQGLEGQGTEIALELIR